VAHSQQKTSKNTRIALSLTKVVIYRRVSTDKQERSGLGMEAQLDLCTRVASAMGLEIVADFSETISGKVNPCDRPMFSEAVALAQQHGARIMVAKLDRFSREVYHVAGFTQKHLWGAATPDLLIAESPNMSQLEIYIKAMLSEEERKEIGKRTRAALAVRKAEGANLGSVGRKIAHDKARQATQEAVDMAIQLRGQGKGYQAIADALNEKGLPTSRGGIWYASVIRSRLVTLGVA
jgi:DNA invertase Pin-like site-specific DNA recombinase